MLEYITGVASTLAVRLLDIAGAPVTGKVQGDVTATIKRDGLAALTLTSGQYTWIEASVGAYSASGYYELRITDLTLLDTVGIFSYAIAVSGAEKFVGVVKFVAAKSPYVTFIGTGETGAPVLVEVVATRQNQIRVTYSEPVVMTTGTNGALRLANYMITGLTVNSITQIDDKTVLLNTSTQTPSAVYPLTVQNVEDLDGTPIE